jgi:hypothetical protein
MVFELWIHKIGESDYLHIAQHKTPSMESGMIGSHLMGS